MFVGLLLACCCRNMHTELLEMQKKDVERFVSILECSWTTSRRVKL